MRPRLVIVLIATMLLSCGDKNAEMKEQITIPAQTMAQIIQDLAKAQQMATINTQTTTENMALMQAYKKDIFDHYKITQETYEQQLKLYLSLPEEMAKVNKYLPKYDDDLEEDNQ